MKNTIWLKLLKFEKSKLKTISCDRVPYYNL